MASRSLNEVNLIGNLTRDPELRYTPQGTAIASFSIATNRQWNDSQGNKKEEAAFHRIVAWSKLGEICSQYLQKGTLVYVKGRLAYREWTDQQNVKHNVTEIIISDMMILSSKPQAQAQPSTANKVEDVPDDVAPEPDPTPEPEQQELGTDKPNEENKEDVNPDDIPF